MTEILCAAQTAVVPGSGEVKLTLRTETAQHHVLLTAEQAATLRVALQDAAILAQPRPEPLPDA